MRVLITGAAGFLGSHLCDRLLADGHEVVGLDDLSTGEADNLAHLADHDRFRFLRRDVTERVRVDGPLDGVLHFASPASPVDYLEMPIETLKAGSLGTYRALGVARSRDARFLLASTSEVYGDPEVHPQPESYRGNVDPVGPRSVYDEAKRYAEALTTAYRREHGLEVRIARIFNTYGPRMRPDDGRVVSNFLVQALRGDPLTVYGDGSQTRSFCYVSDLVEAVVRLFAAEGEEAGDPVNLGNPEETTIRELADRVREVVGGDSDLRRLPLPEDDPKVRRPDVSRARRLLGWTPEVGLREGLERTAEHFRALRDEGDLPAARVLAG